MDRYKETKVAEMQAFADNIASQESCNQEDLQFVELALRDSTVAVNDAMNSDTVDIAVSEAKQKIIDIVVMEEITIPGVSNQFDLSEAKEYWTGSIEDNFMDDRVCVVMKKQRYIRSLSWKCLVLKMRKIFIIFF